MSYTQLCDPLLALSLFHSSSFVEGEATLLFTPPWHVKLLQYEAYLLPLMPEEMALLKEQNPHTGNRVSTALAPVSGYSLEYQVKHLLHL